MAQRSSRRPRAVGMGASIPLRRALLVLPLAVTVVTGCVVVEVPAPDDPLAQAPEAGDPPEPGDTDEEGAVERAVFDMVNREREERGLAPLEWDDALAARAREWSAAMAAEGRLEHQDSEAMRDAVDGYTALGENIFQSTAPVPAGRIHVGWMRSEGHRVNVLEPGFDRLGVGVVCSGTGEVWATQRFGRTAGTDRPGLDRDVPPEAPIVVADDAGPSCAPPGP